MAVTKWYIQMRRLSLLNLCFVLMLLGCISSLPENSNVSPIKMKRFESQVNGYAIVHPRNWDAFEFFNGYHGHEDVCALIILHLELSPNIFVHCKDAVSPSLEDVVDWGEQRIANGFENRGDFVLNEFESVEHNGIQMIERTFTSEVWDEASYKHKEVYIALENKMLILSFAEEPSTYDENINTFEQIVESFELIE